MAQLDSSRLLYERTVIVNRSNGIRAVKLESFASLIQPCVTIEYILPRKQPNIGLIAGHECRILGFGAKRREVPVRLRLKNASVGLGGPHSVLST